MPFIRPPRPRRATPKPPRKAKDKGASPFSVSPEWEAEGELPNLRDKDTFPLPWGGQLEHTLAKSIDPLDCEAWPNSPYCDPASTFDFGNFMGVNIDVTANPCGGVIRATPTVFWLSMAPATVVYRRDGPECQPEVEPRGMPPLSPSKSQGFNRMHFGCFGCIYRIRLRSSVPPGDEDPGISGAMPAIKNDIWVDFFGPLEGFEAFSFERGGGRWGAYLSVWAHGYAQSYPTLFGNPNFPSYSPSGDFIDVWGWGFSSFFSEKNIAWEIVSLELVSSSMQGLYDGFDPNLRFKIAYNFSNCKGCKQLPPPPLPTLPEDMCNCKAMESDLKAIKKILGADKGGWKVPAKLTGLGTEMVEFNNYAELFLWTIKSFSETLGDTEIKIKLKDADLTQDGDQSQELSYANLGEAIADILGLLLDNKGLSGAIYRASAQGLAQSAVATISASKTLKIVEDIADFLDYKVEEEEEEIELFLTPTKEAPSEYLDKSIQKFTYSKYKGKNSLSTHLHDLLFAAALIRAQFWHRVDDEGFSRFETAVEEGQSDFDTFMESTEQGFPSEPGIVDSSRPYGRPYEERPRIRKISQPKNDGSNT